MSPLDPQDALPGSPETAEQQPVVELVSPQLAVAALVGNVDLACYDIVEELLRHAPRDVLIDLTRCDSIDSAGIGALIAARGAATARGHRLALLVRPDQHGVTAALRLSRVADILAVHTSRRAAFDSFRDGTGSR